MKRIYTTLIMLVCFFAVKAQPVSFSVQAHPGDWQLFMSSRLLEDMNGNSKLIFITLTAGDEGNGTATLNSAPLPFYMAKEKGDVFSAKFLYDISVNAAACALDSVPGLQTAAVNGHNIAKYVYKNTVSYFLRLPEGGTAGAGFAATGNKSLKQLKAGTISTLSSIDGANTYNGWADISETILAIVEAEKNNSNNVWLHTGSLDAAVNPGDHSDHVYAATAAKEATSYLSWVGYVDYVNDSSAAKPANLTTSKFQDAAALFGIADYALTANRYSSKLTAANINLMTKDYYTVIRNPSDCIKPSGLTASNITTNSARLSWGKITGAAGYVVEYKSTGAWVSAGANITDSFVVVAGLSASTSYQWRVRTKCQANGNGSGFLQSQFITATCGVPANLSATNITSSGVTVSWGAVAGATGYVLEGKISSLAAWTVVATTTSNTYTVSGLNPSTVYDWRVKTNCSATISSAYAQAQFTTEALCTDILESNNTYYTAKTITPGLNYNAQIAYWGDKDYYMFNNTSAAKNIRITVSNLPGDYDVKLYNPYGYIVDLSQNWGTNSETLVFNTTYMTGTFRVYIYGYNGAYSSTQCYNLKVEISSTPFEETSCNASGFSSAALSTGTVSDITSDAKEKNTEATDKSIEALTIYPMPVYDMATVAFDADASGKALVKMFTATGKQVYTQAINLTQGHNTISLSTLKIPSGTYTLTISNGSFNVTKQIIISR